MRSRMLQFLCFDVTTHQAYRVKLIIVIQSPICHLIRLNALPNSSVKKCFLLRRGFVKRRLLCAKDTIGYRLYRS